MSRIDDGAITPLAARLKQEREARGWALADLAQRSGVSRAMISRIERAEASPTALLLARLAAAFGMPLSVLLARVEADAHPAPPCAGAPTSPPGAMARAAPSAMLSRPTAPMRRSRPPG